LTDKNDTTAMKTISEIHTHTCTKNKVVQLYVRFLTWWLMHVLQESYICIIHIF